MRIFNQAVICGIEIVSINVTITVALATCCTKITHTIPIPAEWMQPIAIMDKFTAINIH